MTTSKTYVVIHTNVADHIAFKDLTDGTEADFVVVNTPGDTGKSLGDALTGQNIIALEVFTATPSDLDKIAVKDEKGGIVCEWEGNITAALFPAPNLVVENVNIPIRKGFTLTGATSD